MCPKRRVGRRRCRRVRATGSFWSSLKNFVSNGARMLGRSFMNNPMKYINGAKNLYNAYKNAPSNGLYRKGRTGGRLRRGTGRRRRRIRRRRTGGAFDSIARR